MTDLLLNIQEIIRSVGIAIALIGLALLFKRFTRGVEISSGPSLQYRSNSNLLILVSVVFVLNFLSSNSVADLFAMNSGFALRRILAATYLPIILAGVIVAYREARLGGWVGFLLNDYGTNEPDASTAGKIFWPLSGFVGLCAVLLYLEHRQPYYFTQDDNLAVNLAEILWACRSFFHGVFPTWNPFQYLGSPNTSLGWYSLTYPPTYFSYWIANTLLGNENATLEVFAFFHLLIGYLVLYWAIRREGCRPSIAMLGASCCMTSGYALIITRSWYQFSPVLLWAGLLVLCVQSFARGSRGWKWILLYGGVVGIAFHAGHVQMWIYSVMLADFAIALLLLTRLLPPRAVWAPIAAHFLALAIAAPLLLAEISTTMNVVREHVDSRGIAPGIVGLFLPATIWPSSHPSGWFGDHHLMGEMYYSGTLFILLGAVLLISLLSSHWSKETIQRNIWFCCAALAFWLALGDKGFLWNLMMHVPGFTRFRFPFKFLAYMVLFGSLAGGIALERIMRNTHWRPRMEVGLAAVMWLVIAYHSTVSIETFYSYGFKPYPKPDPALSSRLTPQSDTSYPKVLPVFEDKRLRFQEGGYRSSDPRFIDSYMNQWPTLSQVFSMEGYNPLVSQTPAVLALRKKLEDDPDRTLYEYGVQYVLRYDPPNDGVPRQLQKLQGAKLVYETSTILLQELPQPRPMSFPAQIPSLALPVKFDGAGATINTSAVAQGGAVVLNLLWKQEFRAMASGKALPIAADDWNRISVQVPSGTPEVRIAYRPHWEYGYVLSLVSLICGLFIGKFAVTTPQAAQITKHKPAREYAIAKEMAQP